MDPAVRSLGQPSSQTPALRSPCPQALAIYQDVIKTEGGGQELHTYAAACLYYLGRYPEAEKEAQKARRPPGPDFRLPRLFPGAPKKSLRPAGRS